MRERLVATFVGMTVAVIALYAVPRAYFIADLVHHEEQRKVERSADLIAVAVAAREDGPSSVDQRFLASLLHRAEQVEYVDVAGDRVRAGRTGTDGHSDLVAGRHVPGGGTVTLSRSGELIDERVSRALMPLVLLGLALTAASAVVGFVLARRLARPFQELAVAAARLGTGRFDTDVPRYSVPEADQIGSALSRSASQLDELVRREREFTVNASHQLRTPVTAVRLELEDLAQWPETPPAVARELEEALAELDRLSEAIGELLALARGRGPASAVDVDLSAIVADTVDRWRPALRREGRRITRDDGGTVPARLSVGPVVQILDALIENACRHGSGTVTVDAEDLGSHLRIGVSDEGVRDFDTEVFRRGHSTGDGTGVGLAVAAELAESIGARLALADGPRTCFTLLLPRYAPGDPTARRDDLAVRG